MQQEWPSTAGWMKQQKQKQQCMDQEKDWCVLHGSRAAGKMWWAMVQIRTLSGALKAAEHTSLFWQWQLCSLRQSMLSS